jgi:hypothetical protein
MSFVTFIYRRKPMIKQLKILFFGLCLLFVSFNAYQLIRKLTADRPITFSGIKFSGLGETLKNEERVGYITDLDIKETPNLVEFQQAQFMLAPAILELNTTSSRYFIVNCSSDAAAIQKLMELRAQPLKRNQFGVILAQKPSFGSSAP